MSDVLKQRWTVGTYGTSDGAVRADNGALVAPISAQAHLFPRSIAQHIVDQHNANLEEAPRGVADCMNCHECLKGKNDAHGLPLTSTRMILCPSCRNKRCPKASYHQLACTGSNEPGQPGSVFTRAPTGGE